jgi:hypothetical protein
MREIVIAARRYRDYAQFMRDQHYGQSDNALRWNIILGIPVTLTAAVISTSIFASINSSPGNSWKILAGLVSLLAAALSALQTFFKFPELGERHRVAAAKYGSVRRALDMFILRYSHADASAEGQALDALEKLATKLGELDESSPAIGTPRPRRRRQRVREIEKSAAAERESEENQAHR